MRSTPAETAIVLAAVPPVLGGIGLVKTHERLPNVNPIAVLQLANYLEEDGQIDMALDVLSARSDFLERAFAVRN